MEGEYNDYGTIENMTPKSLATLNRWFENADPDIKELTGYGKEKHNWDKYLERGHVTYKGQDVGLMLVKKSAFDQQPVEASTMAAAAMAGLRSTGHESYQSVAIRAKRWFSGHNSSMQSLVDVERGACCDGIQRSGLNRNQGAESTLAYLWTELLWNEHELTFKRENNAVFSIA